MQLNPATLMAIANYLYNNYYNDLERFARVKMIGVMVIHSQPDQVPSMIDKIAIFNGFQKSSPPAGESRQELIDSVSAILSRQ